MMTCGLRAAEQHADGIRRAGASQYRARLGLQRSQDHQHHQRLTPDGTPALGMMDVKMLPNDPNGIGYTAAACSTDHIYMIDPKNGTATPAFDSRP